MPVSGPHDPLVAFTRHYYSHCLAEVGHSVFLTRSTTAGQREVVNLDLSNYLEWTKQINLVRVYDLVAQLSVGPM